MRATLELAVDGMVIGVVIGVLVLRWARISAGCQHTGETERQTRRP
jgi:uncharacterized membrane-anchored protein YhcB (DUF1043 family)